MKAICIVTLTVPKAMVVQRSNPNLGIGAEESSGTNVMLWRIVAECGQMLCELRTK